VGLLNIWSKKRSVANRYNVTSTSYDEQYAQEQVAKYRVATSMLSSFSCDNVVLDVGCGSGLFFSHIVDKAKLVVGVDLSRKLLLKANVHAKSFCEVYVVQADADYLPFKDALFDVVFSFTMLQNMPLPKQALVEFKRQVGVGGKLVVTGLKKAFELSVFLDLFEVSGLGLFGFVDDPDLNCYIAVAVK